MLNISVQKNSTMTISDNTKRTFKTAGFICLCLAMVLALFLLGDAIFNSKEFGLPINLFFTMLYSYPAFWILSIIFLAISKRMNWRVITILILLGLFVLRLAPGILMSLALESGTHWNIGMLIPLNPVAKFIIHNS